MAHHIIVSIFRHHENQTVTRMKQARLTERPGIAVTVIGTVIQKLSLSYQQYLEHFYLTGCSWLSVSVVTFLLQKDKHEHMFRVCMKYYGTLS